MRQGRVVASLPTAETTSEQLAELMVGRKVSLRVAKEPGRPGEPVLEVSELVVEDGLGVERVKGVSFAVRAGEILGVVGVTGNGQSELLEALAGIRPVKSGHIRWRARDLSDEDARSPRRLRRLGLSHVPEDRQRMGLVMPFAARESAILGYHGEAAYNGLFQLHQAAVASSFCRQAAEYDVRPADGARPTSAFSGGNQQKIVLARELDRHPDLLLVGQPTRGVDIGAIEFIHRRLVALRDAGKGVLLVSAELDEILALADRIVVMHAGHLVGEISPAAATEQTIGLMMAGVPAGPG
jgi:ABC-type uncharacterized transport system ATPase subunit